jgi:alcohol dehydrogenase
MKTRAAVLYRTDHPEPFAQSVPITVEDVEVTGPGFGQVLVEVAAAGICHSDLSVVNGSRPRAMPMVLGHEASGIVREVGQGVVELSAGDHVVFSFVPVCGRCLCCATGKPALCENGARANAAGTLLDGKRHFSNAAGQELHHHLGVSAFSQYTVVAQESVVRIDFELPLETAALFGCAVMTGVGAVFNTARVEPGSSVAIFGLGGVGLSALLGARAAGAHPIIAVDSLASKLELARTLGATEVVQAGTDHTVAAVRELSNGGVAYAFECAGSEKALVQAYQATRRGGTTLTLGLAAPDRQFSIPAVTLVTEERTLKGSYMGSAVPSRDIPRYIALYRAGMLPVDALLSCTLALEDVNPAFDSLHRGEVVRQVIRFGNPS